MAQVGWCSAKIFKIHSFDCKYVACCLGKLASKLSIRLCIRELAVSVMLCSKFCFFPLTRGYDRTSAGSSNLWSCYCRFLHQNFELHAWTMWFCSFEYVNSATSKSEFQLVKHVTGIASPASQNKCEKKELCDLLVDQITQEIPVANSTLSPLFFHERFITLQNGKEDAHRLPFLWQVHQTHDFLGLFSIAFAILMISEMTSASW